MWKHSDSWNRRMRGVVVVENRGIVDCNKQNEAFTPFVHIAVFLPWKRAYVFKSDLFLEDGINLKQSLKNKWRRELRRVHMKNLKKYHEWAVYHS